MTYLHLKKTVYSADVEKVIRDEIIRQSELPDQYTPYIVDDDQELGVIEIDGPLDIRKVTIAVMGLFK